MTLLDERGEVRDSLASGLSAAEAERVWSTPEGLRIFQSLTELSEPLRLPDLETHVRGLGFGDFSTPQPTVPAYRFLAAPMFHRGARAWATSSWATRKTAGSSAGRTRRRS